jgi:hypothetical protein
MKYFGTAFLIFFVFFFANASPVIPDDKCEKEDMKLYNEGIEALNKGYYNSARELFMELHYKCEYKEFNFLMAYIHDKKGHYVDAWMLYRRFLKESRPGEDYRDFAIRRYNELDAAITVSYPEETNVKYAEGKSDESGGAKYDVKKEKISPAKRLPKINRHMREYLNDPPTNSFQ